MRNALGPGQLIGVIEILFSSKLTEVFRKRTGQLTSVRRCFVLSVVSRICHIFKKVWVFVPTAWSSDYGWSKWLPDVEVTEIILIKQSRTAENVWSSRLGVQQGNNRLLSTCYEMLCGGLKQGRFLGFLLARNLLFHKMFLDFFEELFLSFGI